MVEGEREKIVVYQRVLHLILPGGLQKNGQCFCMYLKNEGLAMQADIKKNCRIVLEPVFPQKEVDMESLIAGITEENVHTEVNFGSAIGKERFDGPSVGDQTGW